MRILFGRVAALVLMFSSAFVAAHASGGDPLNDAPVPDSGVRLLFVGVGSPDAGSPTAGYGTRLAVLPRSRVALALGLEASLVWPGGRERFLAFGPFVRWMPRSDARYPPHLHVGIGYTNWKHDLYHGGSSVFVRTTLPPIDRSDRDYVGLDMGAGLALASTAERTWGLEVRYHDNLTGSDEFRDHRLISGGVGIEWH